jgi:hypothetical protein
MTKISVSSGTKFCTRVREFLQDEITATIPSIHRNEMFPYIKLQIGSARRPFFGKFI